jgi:predicted metal-dependent enzyme (double-stranded beta helix superfamily)
MKPRMISPKFDVDDFVASCQEAARTDEPLKAARAVLERAIATPSAVAEVLGRDTGGLEPLYASPELTIINIVWTPGVRLDPHDHLMWAAVGVYGGTEENEFYGRDGEGLAERGGKIVAEGEVMLLGDDVIHAVTNRTTRFGGAIHIYGGDFFHAPRTEWDRSTLEAHPWTADRTQQRFAEANERYAAEHAHG